MKQPIKSVVDTAQTEYGQFDFGDVIVHIFNIQNFVNVLNTIPHMLLHRLVLRDDLMQFYKESIYSFIGLVGVSLLLIYLFVNHSIFSNQDHKWLIKLLAIIYIVLLTILSSVKKIVGIAISQENKMRNEKNN